MEYGDGCCGGYSGRGNVDDGWSMRERERERESLLEVLLPIYIVQMDGIGFRGPSNANWT